MSETLPSLGIDMAKLSFEAHLRLPPATTSHGFPNTPEGFEQVEQWLKRQGVQCVHACMEATGTYSDGLAHALHEHGHQVSVVNPARIAAFRKSKGFRTKTDKQDAKLIALYCEQEHPALWTPPPAEVQLLDNLVQRRADLLLMQQQERNRLENSRWDAQTSQSIHTHIASLALEIKAVTKRISTHMQAHPHLQEQREWLISLPGIADLTAAHVLAVGIGPEHFVSASQVVGYTGLAIKDQDSGTSVHGKATIDRIGNADLRKALYMPALVAMRVDPDFARWVSEMRARHKPPKIIIVAVMRKLLHLIYGVLKSKEPYDPCKAFPTHYSQEEVQVAA